MDLRCPQCGIDLQVAHAHMAASILCPACGHVFRADAGAAHGSDVAGDVIDVDAEVLSDTSVGSDRDGADTGPEAAEAQAGATVISRDADARREGFARRRVYVVKKVVVKDGDGCGCGSCGCLVLLFLLLLFLVRCAAFVAG